MTEKNPLFNLFLKKKLPDNSLHYPFFGFNVTTYKTMRHKTFSQEAMCQTIYAYSFNDAHIKLFFKFLLEKAYK